MGYRNKNYDKAMHDELELGLQNDYPSYQVQVALAKNYARKIKRGVFNKNRAIEGVHNLLVVPYARKYQKEFNVKIGPNERKGVSRSIFKYMWREMLR